MNYKTLKIRFTSYDAAVLDNFCQQVCANIRGVAVSTTCVPLPAKRELIKVKRSSFVYSSSVHQMARKTYVRCLIIKCSDVVVLHQRLSSTKLPCGVEVKLSVC